jgi:hypothetical protein
VSFFRQNFALEREFKVVVAIHHFFTLPKSRAALEKESKRKNIKKQTIVYWQIVMKSTFLISSLLINLHFRFGCSICYSSIIVGNAS